MRLAAFFFWAVVFNAGMSWAGIDHPMSELDSRPKTASDIEAEKRRQERERERLEFKSQQNEVVVPIQSQVSTMPGETITRPSAWFLAQVDFISAEDSLDGEDTVRDLATHFTGESGTFSGDSSTSGTPLISAGYMFRLTNRADIGFLLGWARLEQDAHLNHSTPLGTENANGHFDATVWRYTVNLRWRRPVSRHAQLRFRGGAGLTAARLQGRTTVEGSGSLGAIPGGGFGSFKENTTENADEWAISPTLDVFPSIAFTSPVGTVDVGVSYTLFGSLSTDSTSGASLSWHPIGLRLALEF